MLKLSCTGVDEAIAPVDPTIMTKVLPDADVVRLGAARLVTGVNAAVAPTEWTPSAMAILGHPRDSRADGASGGGHYSYRL